MRNKASSVIFVISTWEHMECIRTVVRPSEAMYEALTENRIKAILYVCSRYHNRGTVSKCLCKFEMEYEYTCEEWLGSAHTR